MQTPMDTKNEQTSTMSEMQNLQMVRGKKIKHGRSRYARQGCRCEICCNSYSSYWKKYMKEIRNGERGEERLSRLRSQQKKQNNKPHFIANQQKQNKERRAYLYKLKSVPCKDCGKTYPALCMDFHHKKGTIKKFTICESMQRNWEAILIEITKCDIICSNCHRIRHYNEKRRQNEKIN